MGFKKQSKNHTGGPEEQQSLGDGTGIEKKKKNSALIIQKWTSWLDNKERLIYLFLILTT